MMLRELRRTHRTRNILEVACVLVLVALLATLVVRAVAPTPRLQPGGRATPTSSPACPAGVTCLGGAHATASTCRCPATVAAALELRRLSCRSSVRERVRGRPHRHRAGPPA